MASGGCCHDPAGGDRSGGAADRRAARDAARPAVALAVGNRSRGLGALPGGGPASLLRLGRQLRRGGGDGAAAGLAAAARWRKPGEGGGMNDVSRIGAQLTGMLALASTPLEIA